MCIRDRIEIKNRDTDKKQKTDKVLTNITTEKDDVSYEKKVTLTYHKYNNGWEVQDIYANPPGDWVVKPLKEVSEEQFNSTPVSYTHLTLPTILLV